MSEISIRALKTIGFSRLSLEEKIKISDAGRPTPYINLVQITKCKTRESKRALKNYIYAEHNWLCGCSVANRLFCFPCILFGRLCVAESSWVSADVADLSHLEQKDEKQENSQSNM